MLPLHVKSEIDLLAEAAGTVGLNTAIQNPLFSRFVNEKVTLEILSAIEAFGTYLKVFCDYVVWVLWKLK